MVLGENASSGIKTMLTVNLLNLGWWPRPMDLVQVRAQEQVCFNSKLNCFSYLTLVYFVKYKFKKIVEVYRILFGIKSKAICIEHCFYNLLWKKIDYTNILGTPNRTTCPGRSPEQRWRAQRASSEFSLMSSSLFCSSQLHLTSSITQRFDFKS